MGKPGPNCKSRICKLCGVEYVPTSTRQNCCNREIQVQCEICGKSFTKRCTTSDNRRTCSYECSVQLQNKIRTKNSSEKLSKCKWCGQLFHPTSNRNVYCKGPHYKTCVVCNKSFEIDPITQANTQTCSKDCFVLLQLSHRDIAAEKEKQRKVLLDKYGVENASQIPGSQEKAKKTMLEKYGSEWYTQTEEYRKRIQNTSLEKYGVEHWLSSEDIKQKRMKTVQEKYGSDNVFNSEYGRSKIKSYLDSNNVENVSQLHIRNLNVWNQFKEDPKAYIIQNYTSKVTIQELAHDLNVSSVTVNELIDDDTRNLCILRDFSKMETAVSLMIQDIRPGTIIHHNKRTIIPPYEIDIYLPEFRIGIECNPTITHNSTLSDPYSDKIKDIHYHQTKTNLAVEKEIRLIHIPGYQWSNCRDKIESILRNALKSNIGRIHARNTYVRNVPENTAKEFLKVNHLQGYLQSSIRLGLCNKNQIVAIMTFMGTSESEYELIQFCSCLNTTVVGGASKLFSYFLKEYRPDSVTAFSDRSMFTGQIYNILKFKRIGSTEPNYVTIDIKSDKLIKDCETSDDSVRVYDSGYYIWKYTE